MTRVELRIASQDWTALTTHLLRKDGSENGAVVLCGVSHSAELLLLTAKRVVPATEGVDYVPGQYGYRALAASFVGDQIDSASEDGLAYLAIHNHGGRGRVGFSSTDMQSHERGYPTLLQYVDGPPVGGIVINAECVAGDIWMADGRRLELDRVVVVDTASHARGPAPTRIREVAEAHDRQARMFGQAGQDVLRNQTVAVVGVGGVGSMVVEQLAHLGVGGLVLIDPDEIETSNLSRVVGARPTDARRRFRRHGGLRFGAAFKVDVAARNVAGVDSSIAVETLAGTVVDPDIAERLKSVDQIFLAADTAQARLVVNAVAHQYLISAMQIGSKVSVTNGTVDDIFSVVRAIGPDYGCLNCSGLISAARLQEEATDPDQLKRQRYVDDSEVHAPSVISLNGIGASIAVNAWMLSVTGVQRPEAEWLEYHPLSSEFFLVEPAPGPCVWCGDGRAMGDGKRLPVRMK